RCEAVSTELIAHASEGTAEELQWWTRAFKRDCADQRDDLMRVAAWAALPAMPPFPERQGAPEQNARIAELQTLLTRLDEGPTLRTVAALQETAVPFIDKLIKDLGEKVNDD